MSTRCKSNPFAGVQLKIDRIQIKHISYIILLFVIAFISSEDQSMLSQ